MATTTTRTSIMTVTIPPAQQSPLTTIPRAPTQSTTRLNSIISNKSIIIINNINDDYNSTINDHDNSKNKITTTITKTAATELLSATLAN
eukprot:scaffold90684_cov15-Prasinocladus_malaysianus.AAC.2